MLHGCREQRKKSNIQRRTLVPGGDAVTFVKVRFRGITHGECVIVCVCVFSCKQLEGETESMTTRYDLHEIKLQL